MAIRGYLLKEMALARAAGTKFDKVVIALHEWDHPQQGNSFCPLVELIRLKADRPQEEINPILRAFEFRTPLIQGVQNVCARHLDWAKRFNPKRSTVLLLRYDTIICQRNLGIE